MATIQHRPEVGKKLKIDKSIPIPEKGSGMYKTKGFNDALDIMEVGDSVEFPLDAKRKNGYSSFSKEGASFYAVARRRGIKLLSRRDNDTGTVRYWRVE
tara:strand:+ start:120 stop:416 length:297 start_codon:yes stop_codon:yes gene_type:complete